MPGMRWQLAAGLLLWTLVLFLWPLFSLTDALHRALLFGVFVLNPLALSDNDPRHQASRAARVARWLQLPGAICATLVLYLRPDNALLVAVLLTPYALVILGAAISGGIRLAARGVRPWNETLIDLGRLQWTVGGIWLGAHALRIELLGFQEPIVLLTAIHFHFAGFYLPVIAGRLFRKTLVHAPRLTEFVSIGLSGSIPFTAIGIAVGRPLESIAATCTVFFVAAFALIVLRYSLRLTDRLQIRLLVWLSSLSGIAGMILALLFAWLPEIGLAFMAHTHGWINALGLCACGLMAATLLDSPAIGSRRIPFSRLVGGWHIGRQFFARTGMELSTSSATGLVDDMDEYARSDFDVNALPAVVREFYEKTDHFDLRIDPRYAWYVRPLAWLYKTTISSRLEQMNFPLEKECDSALIRSRIVSLDSAQDGRERVRAWLRWYVSSGRAIYAAAYSSHAVSGERFMNISFPLPGGNLTSILRLELIHDNAMPVLLLTSLPDASKNHFGDQGVFFVRSDFVFRLPVNESIYVWKSESKDVEVEARHEMWLFGLRVLTLHYTINRLLGNNRA